MGREWYWVGGGRSSKRKGREEKYRDNSPSGCMCAVFQLFDFHQFQFPLQHQETGNLKPESSIPENDNSVPKRAEVPSESLESQEETNSLLSTIKEDDENLNIPVGIKIKTNGDRIRSKSHGGAAFGNDCCCSSETCFSPGTKTPTLVARLMGLDLLPDHSSSPNVRSATHFRPRQSHQAKSIFNHRDSMETDFIGTRSLPETPRISSARKSDAEYHHHRLSLQLNKENVEESVLSRISALRKLKTDHQDEYNRSPVNYARQIVKQVKESVGKKVGLSDITNKARNRDQERISRDELVSRFKAKKISKFMQPKNSFDNVDADLTSGKHLSASCSPRLRFLEPKNRPISNVASTKDHIVVSDPPKPSLSQSSPLVRFQDNKVSTKPKLNPEVQVRRQQQERPIKTTKKMAEKRFSRPQQEWLKKPPQTLDILRNKQEESFVRPMIGGRANIPDRNCKKTPISHNLLSIAVPTLLPAKKDPSPPATKIPQKQVTNAQDSKRISSSQLSSCLSQSYKNQQQARDSSGIISNNNNVDIPTGPAAATPNTGNGGAAAAAAEEYEYYVTKILRRTGIDIDAPILCFTNWFSPSHPLDPSIFHQLELQDFTSLDQLRHKCNRKLVFHLVDEMLVEILKPWTAMTTSVRVQEFGRMKGSHLVSMLCSKITSYPDADCRVLEDIDALIEKDLPPQLKVQSQVGFGEEREGIVKEMVKLVLDALMHETALIFLSFRWKRHGVFGWREKERETIEQRSHMGDSRDDSWSQK